MLIELVTMNVEHRRRVSLQHTLLEPGLIAPCGQGVVSPSGPEVDAFYVANAETGADRWLSSNVVRSSDERTDRAGAITVEADSTQGTDVSHEARGPIGRC